MTLFSACFQTPRVVQATASVGGGRAMETVAAGSVAGCLVRAPHIHAGVVPPGVEAAVLLVDYVDGTEELMRCDPAIKGVVSYRSFAKRVYTFCYGKAI